MIYYGEIYTLPKIKRESNIIRGGGGVQLLPEGDTFSNF